MNLDVSDNRAGFGSGRALPVQMYITGHNFSSNHRFAIMSTPILNESRLGGGSFLSRLLSAAKKELGDVALGRRCAESLR